MRTRRSPRTLRRPRAARTCAWPYRPPAWHVRSWATASLSIDSVCTTNNKLPVTAGQGSRGARPRVVTSVRRCPNCIATCPYLSVSGGKCPSLGRASLILQRYRAVQGISSPRLRRSSRRTPVGTETTEAATCRIGRMLGEPDPADRGPGSTAGSAPPKGYEHRSTVGRDNSAGYVEAHTSNSPPRDARSTSFPLGLGVVGGFIRVRHPAGVFAAEAYLAWAKPRVLTARFQFGGQARVVV